jgi:hypothetical protein
VFEIGRLYHLTQVVDDLDAVDRWYERVFSALRIYHGRHELAMRDASIVVIANAVIEVIQVVELPGSEHTPLGRYHRRFGQHLHSVAMFVDDLGDAGATLQAHGVRLTDTLGRPVQAERPDRTIWTHPRDTIAMFQFAVVPRFTFDPRLHPSWDQEFWRRHPLGIERLGALTVLVSDLDAARPVFCETMGRECVGIEEIAGVKRVERYGFGTDLDIEVVQPLDPNSPEWADLARVGQGPFGFSFDVGDLGQAERYLLDSGQSVRRSGADQITIDPTDAHGISISFTQARTRPEGR